MNGTVINLIQGEFSKEEAFEVLVNLYQGKIQFHERKNFSSMERFGRPCESSLSRIVDLKKTHVKLNQTLKDLGTDSTLFHLESVINITPIEVVK